ncbi:MFS transporter [Paenibacillus aurantiacus]|uniref:MFS transporter n=1 Tax=Paenibacillus aurantiacus TaxID=1936118 RepID=A0ABV5KUR6_9BACL
MDNALEARTKATGNRAQGLLLFGISLGYFMVLLDTTIISVALPAIRADLGGGISGLQWIVNAYTIVFAGLLLSMGSIADKLGARRVYIGGAALFLVASALSAAVSSLGALIALRIVLGAGGAALLPASLTLIAHAFPDPKERARALGIWAAFTGMALAAGPVVGGILVDSVGWRSIFLLNVPLALISLTTTLLFTKRERPQSRQHLDLNGQVLAIAAIVALSFGLMKGGSYGWSSAVIVTVFGVALASAVLFVIVERRGKSPLLPLQLFRNPAVSAGMIAGMIMNLGLSGILFVLPLFFQQLRGLSAYSAGLALLPMMIPMVVNPIWVGRIVPRVGARTFTTIGFGLGALGTWMLVGVDVHTSDLRTILGLLLFGFGVTFTIPPLVTAVVSSVPKELTGAASGALNASRQLGATLGVAVLGAIIDGSGSFVSGMHAALMLTTIILLGGSLLSFFFMGSSKKGKAV